MNWNEYVILRTDGPVAEVLGDTGGGPGAARAVHLETQTLSGGLKDLEGQVDVLGAAKKLPIKLVEPFPTDGRTADPTTDEAVWGLAAVGALSTQRRGKGATVAILDTGIHRSHDAFEGKAIIEKDFTGDGNGDRNGHGTHCAGTLFGGEVGGKRIGVAPDVDKALIGKVFTSLGDGTTEHVFKGLVWAISEGADVISMSFGLDVISFVDRLQRFRDLPPTEATSIALEAYRENLRLYDRLSELMRTNTSIFSQSLIIAAAGNQSRRPRYEIGLDLPAVADGILSVGALRRTNDSTGDLLVADFSNSGPDLAAPGVEVESACHDDDSGLCVNSGTSMATAHVAGVAALWTEELRARPTEFKMSLVEANLLARVKANAFAEGIEPRNYGAGLVWAPQP